MAVALVTTALASKVQALALNAALTIFGITFKCKKDNKLIVIITINNNLCVVVVSGMQLLQLRSAIRRHQPPQRAVLSQICCFWERKVVLSKILLDGAEPRDARMT